MAANTTPITPGTPVSAWDNSAPLLTADAGMASITTYKTLITAGVNGARVPNVKIKHLGTNVATVVRFFINNGSAPGTAGNISLIKEVAMAAHTGDAVSESPEALVNLNCVLAPGYSILYTLGNSVAAGFAVTTMDAGNY